MAFTLLIDESGQAGIKKVRSKGQPGASPYMTLGGVILPNQSKDWLRKRLSSIESQLNKKKFHHCSHLGHFDLLFLAREMGYETNPVRFFGVISRKETLDSYKKEISNNSDFYYNKCAQYLLERVGLFMEKRGISKDKLEIVFEKGNFNYAALKNLIRRCQENPKHQNTKRLRFIDPDRISTLKKTEEPLLKVADLVAHSLYKCVHKPESQHQIPEPRYLKELSPRFFGHPTDESVLRGGLFCVHSSPDLRLDAEVEELFLKMKAFPPVKK